MTPGSNCVFLGMFCSAGSTLSKLILETAPHAAAVFEAAVTKSQLKKLDDSPKMLNLRLRDI